MRGSNRLEDCTILLVVGTPALRPDHVARLARAYYHADPEVIDETSERAEDGTWHYLDPRMQRVADALIRAELTQCAHRNRPLRHDGRVVVTLCAGLILDLPVTTEITSLPQLTADGLPLALTRRAAGTTRMANAAAALEARGEAVTSRALAEAARISLNTACAWLRTRRTDTMEPAPLLSALPYSPYCTADNGATIPAVASAGVSSGCSTPNAALELAPDALAPATAVISQPPTTVCPAASHQLLWRWAADAWRCPLCDTTRPPAPGAWGQHYGGNHP
jgi:hypothetical protein